MRLGAVCAPLNGARLPSSTFTRGEGQVLGHDMPCMQHLSLGEVLEHIGGRHRGRLHGSCDAYVPYSSSRSGSIRVSVTQ